jgi:predicted amidohydrolase YtcJ
MRGTLASAGVASFCALALALAAAGSNGGSRSGDSAPELILYGGTVLTMDRDAPRAEAVAIRAGKIVGVGSNGEVLALGKRSTRRVNLHGRTVLPGFVDSHSHLFNDADSKGLTLGQAQRLGLQHGVTALGDMFVPPEFLERMRTFAQSGRLRIRTSLYLIYNTNCGEILGNWYLGEGPIVDPARLLRIPGVKIFSDGGSCGRPAISWTYPPGAPGAGTQGDLWLTREQLTAAIIEAQSHGWQVAVHALGDRALDAVFDALTTALGGGPNSLRHRIEHNAFIRDDQLPRYAALGVVPTIFGRFGTCAFNNGGFGRADLVPQAEPWLWRWRDLVDVGPRVAWSSDWPVFSVDPLEHLYGFVTRREVDTDGTICQPEPEQANDTVPIMRALRMLTIDAAFALRQDSAIGSIEIGKFADLVILARNPLQVDPDELPHIEVLVTMIGGRAEYCAAGTGPPCST